jgi:hypothetical protein
MMNEGFGHLSEVKMTCASSALESEINAEYYALVHTQTAEERREHINLLTSLVSKVSRTGSPNGA